PRFSLLQAEIHATQVSQAGAAHGQDDRLVDVVKLRQCRGKLRLHAPAGKLAGDVDAAAKLERGGSRLRRRALHIQRDGKVRAAAVGGAGERAHKRRVVAGGSLRGGGAGQELLRRVGGDGQAGRRTVHWEDGTGVGV